MFCKLFNKKMDETEKRLDKIRSKCCEGEENLKKLRMLTDEMTKTFPQIVKSRSHGFVELKMVEGSGLGWNLLDEKNTSVDHWFSSKGSLFPKHQHNAKEWIVVYEGYMKIHLDDNTCRELKRGDSYFTLPNTAHSAEFMEDTWYITITIPKAEGFPNDGSNGR